MQHKNDSITIRLDKELSDWLKQKAITKNCKVSDLVRESILKYKEMEIIPDDLVFLPSLHVKGSKAALMTYRLLERLTHELIENGGEVIEAARECSQHDIEKCKIN